MIDSDKIQAFLIENAHIISYVLISNSIDYRIQSLRNNILNQYILNCYVMGQIKSLFKQFECSIVDETTFKDRT